MNVETLEELREILRAHAKKYPAMEPTDAVKLIYQNEFGGGHMIRDEEACLNYLYREYAAVEQDPAAPLYELIGNGLVRVNLAALAEKDLAQLGRAFIRSAGAHQGDPARFQAKLEVLLELAEAGTFGFGPEELKRYLAEYVKAGCPAVSHSAQYRQAYKPAYRVVARGLGN